MTKAVLFFNPKSWHPYSWREAKACVNQMVNQDVKDFQDCLTDNQDNPRHLGLNSR